MFRSLLEQVVAIVGEVLGCSANSLAALAHLGPARVGRRLLLVKVVGCAKVVGLRRGVGSLAAHHRALDLAPAVLLGLDPVRNLLAEGQRGCLLVALRRPGAPVTEDLNVRRVLVTADNDGRHGVTWGGYYTLA